MVVDPIVAGSTGSLKVTVMAAVTATPVAALAGWLIYRPKIDHRFLIRLFAAGLLVRIFLGTMIYVFQQQTFFSS